MNESKLMSYITSDFASKSDMRVGAEEWQKYKDEKAFIECQKLFREAEMKFDQKAQISVKNFSNRGIILYDVIL